jgi:hypothetical protein
MADITGVEVFDEGTWNGITFESPDLDAMVHSFNELNLSGKLPVRIGHDDALGDSEPSYGWVQRCYRAGRKLMMDLTQVPQMLVDAIKAGRFKRVSIELLQDAELDGKTYPWVPDALAILGASHPAVTTLADLQSVLHTRENPVRFASRTTFSRVIEPELPTDVTELRTQLRAVTFERDDLKRKYEKFAAGRATEVAILHQRAILDSLENAVRAGKILPATRERLTKLYKLKDRTECLKFSREQLTTVIELADASSLSGYLKGHKARGDVSEVDRLSPADALAERTREVFARGGFANLFEASVQAVKEDPSQMEEMLAHDFGHRS